VSQSLTGATGDPWHRLRALTPARIGLGRAGVSLPTAAHLDFQLAHARARDAVRDALDVSALTRDLDAAGLDSLRVRSAAGSREHFLKRPDLGRRLDGRSAETLAAARRAAPRAAPDAVFVIADGLAASAAQRHAVPVIAAAAGPLRAAGWRLAPVVVAEQGRVALADEIGARLGAALAVVLLGERPGLSAPDSLGAYLTWQPIVGRTDAERNCVSNIRPRGLPYDRAAATLVHLMTEARRRRLSGVALKADRGALGR
jgi:ethanolamine ammonia-lyase small subunit